MPHRNLTSGRQSLPSLSEADEDDETGTPSYSRHRPRPHQSPSAPSSTRPRHTTRPPARSGHSTSAPGGVTLARGSRTRLVNNDSRYANIIRRGTLDHDDHTPYGSTGGQESDDEDAYDDLHGRRSALSGAEAGLNGILLDDLTVDEEVEPETAEDMRRMEWQAMLASVLNGDVLRSEKTRIVRALESYEAQRINRLDLWQELRARMRGRSVEEEQDSLEEKRRRLVGPVIEEILNFKVVSCEENDRPIQSSPALSRSISSADLSPELQVASLLRRLDAAESLYPSLKALRQDHPEAGSAPFLERLDALNSWFRVVTVIRKSIDGLKVLTGNDALDVAHHPRPNTPDIVPPTPSERPNQETMSFAERIVKEDGLQRTFERGALIDLNGHIHHARLMYVTFSSALEEMGLPKFMEELIVCISFPTQLMEHVLRVRIAIAQQLADPGLGPSVLSVDQLLDDFRLAIGLACTLRNDYEDLVRPEPTGQWNIPTCIGSEYENTLLEALKFFFKLMHLKLKDVLKGVYFKETELVEAQWSIMEEVAIATSGGSLLVADYTCALTNRLIAKVQKSFLQHVRSPPSTRIVDSPHSSHSQGDKTDDRHRQQQHAPVTHEDTIRWFTQVLDGVRLRHRKLQRYSRLLMSRFGNSAEYTFEDVDTTELMDVLMLTGHFLVYTESYEAQGVYIIGDASLYRSPEVMRNMLSKAFQVYGRGPRGEEALEESDLASINEESDDIEDGQYLLLLTPQDNFVWRGKVLMLPLNVPEVELGMERNRVRLISPTPPRLRVAKQKFASFFADPEMELSPDEEFEPPFDVVYDQGPHLPLVAHRMRNIAKATHHLAEVIVDSVHDVKATLTDVEGAQELMENWFLFASEHGQAALRTGDRQIQNRLSRRLNRLAISWVAFICDSCDPTDRRTFRWAVNALEFAMARTRGSNILALPEADFKTLQHKVASCMTLLVSHFDILGARSSHEEQQKEREREVTKGSDELASNSVSEQAYTELILAHDGVINAPPDRSLRQFSERVLYGLGDVDERRGTMLAEQRIAGRVLLEESAEDESLSLLAATASKTSIKWQQGRFIAAGAFGSVYLAMNLETGGVMAAKEIRFKNTTSLTTLYQQVKDELAVMEVLHHPNIVEYYGLEVHRDKIYIFEEYCSGGTLTSLLESGRIEDETVVKLYTMQMLEGIEYLHSMGVVHRDIKPDNILLDHNGVIKFVDFGAAKVLAKNKGSIQVGRSLFMASINQSAPPVAGGAPLPMNSLTGTPMYMSPEVIKSDRRSRKGAMDIWSMGCVVLECVTGRKPWSNLDNEWAIMFHIGVATQHPPLPEPSQMSSLGINFLRKCLTIDGMKRPTASELLYDDPWMKSFRDELAEYDDAELDSLATPSLRNSSIQTELSEAQREVMASNAAFSPGMISPPGVFSDSTPEAFT